MYKIALLFPGQGSQYVGMGKKLYDLYGDVRETFEEANDALGFDLKSICFEGSMEELTKTENTQPAILTASVAAFRAYMREIGIQPMFMAGHSLGEFTALCCAGAIKFSDAVKIVRLRGKFMQEAVAVGVGGMAAVSGVSRDMIEEECARASNGSNIVVVSNDNAPDQIVISGHIAAVNEAGEKLAQKGARVIPLKVSAPFHSPLMKAVADRLRGELTKYKFRGLNFPVISNVTALPYSEEESITEYLTKQMVQPVQWQASMQYMQNQGVKWVVEAGPQTVLRNLMTKNAPEIKAFSYDNDQDVGALKQLVSPKGQQSEGVKLGTDVITKCIAIAICTKNSNWDEEEYQMGVVQPYRKIKNMKDEIEKEGRQPQIEEIRAALEMLKSVFITKKTPKEEQQERFNEIFEATGIGQVLQDFEMPS